MKGGDHISYLSDMPRTQQYDQDLGWLIKAYKKLVPAVKDLQERVDTLEELYNTIPDEIKKATDAMIAEVNDAIKEMEDKLAAEIVNINNKIEIKISEIDAKMQALEALIQQKVIEFDELIKKLNETYYQIIKYVEDNNNYIKNWVIAYIMEWEKKFPLLIDPTDGKVEDIQTILYHMYNYLGFGIPVNEFDALDMTAQEFDDRQYTAECLDRWGKFLFRDWQCCRMFSPFTGEKVPISEVVLGLARLHQNAVTANELDEADLDVEMVDEKEVSAYDWDWTSVWFDQISGTGG